MKKSGLRSRPGFSYATGHRVRTTAGRAIPSTPLKIIIYVPPLGGWSTLAIDFLHYLVREHNLQVLFVADEEKLGYTLQKKINRLKAVNPNLHLSDVLPADLNGYDVLFIDCINSIKMTIESMEALSNMYPRLSFVNLFQTTKEGEFKGPKDYEHWADVVILAAVLKAKPKKSRFEGKDMINIL